MPIDLSPNSLLDIDNALLTRPLSNAEVYEAIHSFKPLKEPGPDGLHPIFFKRY